MKKSIDNTKDVILSKLNNEDAPSNLTKRIPVIKKRSNSAENIV